MQDYPRVNVGTANRPDHVTLDREPDSCPHCGKAGRQEPLGPVIRARDGGSLRCVWVAFRCPVNVCRRPFFAVYHETPPDPYGADYRLMRLTPSTPGQWSRSAVIDALSPDFYDIMDQAWAAEKHGLSLIAGMGYRKALEFLVKDYVSEEDRNRLAEAESRGDTTDADLRRTAIAHVQNELLSASIQRIADPRVRAIAERCSWLGNDECHYTRIWTKMDVSDLKTLLNLVTNFIEAESAAVEMLERMPKKT